MVEAAYTNPRVTAATRSSRSRVEDGATRKTGSIPAGPTASSQGCGLVRGQVRRDHPGPARRGHRVGEPLHPVPLDRVPVRHHQGRRAGRGHRPDGLQDVVGRGARLEGDLGRRAGWSDRPSAGRCTAARSRPRRPLRRPSRSAPRRTPARSGSRRAGSRRARPGPPPGSGRRAPRARSLLDQAEPARGGVHVLVAAAGQVHQDDAVGSELAPDLAARRGSRAPTRSPG